MRHVSMKCISHILVVEQYENQLNICTDILQKTIKQMWTSLNELLQVMRKDYGDSSEMKSSLKNERIIPETKKRKKKKKRE